jgi:nucleoside-diphosphate-sugar epimerase
MSGDTSPWRSRRVLVTGCTGFLGTATTRELLARGATVVGLVRDRSGGAEFAREQGEGQFRVVHGRAEDAIRLHSAMAVHEVSAAFHFAAPDAPAHDRGTAAVLRAAALYDPRMPVVAARPAHQFRLAGEEPPAVPFGVARFGELFGGGDRDALGVVARTAVTLLTDRPGAGAGGGPARDFVHVRDAARACLAVADAVAVEGGPLDFTFRSGWECTETAMAALVADVFAGRIPEAPGEAPPNPLGWHPEAPLADALAETIAWYREFVRARTGVPHPGDVIQKAA